MGFENMDANYKNYGPDKDKVVAYLKVVKLSQYGQVEIRLNSETGGVEFIPIGMRKCSLLRRLLYWIGW